MAKGIDDWTGLSSSRLRKAGRSFIPLFFCSSENAGFPAYLPCERAKAVNAGQ